MRTPGSRGNSFKTTLDCAEGEISSIRANVHGDPRASAACVRRRATRDVFDIRAAKMLLDALDSIHISAPQGSDSDETLRVMDIEACSNVARRMVFLVSS